ncbi:Phosphoglucose isomerase-domain-containing protein [Pelagophyceae sp. CCMP2097]|nr:Phosphoglucose isomerase-domain-containing protein [Pelagophyceae sp. CCMP2097]
MAPHSWLRMGNSWLLLWWLLAVTPARGRSLSVATAHRLAPNAQNTPGPNAQNALGAAGESAAQRVSRGGAASEALREMAHGQKRKGALGTRADGQSHYQHLHRSEIGSGIRAHLQQDAGVLGSELDRQAAGVRRVGLTSTDEWKNLDDHAATMSKTHLRDLLNDAKRCDDLVLEAEGLLFDYARQKVSAATMVMLFKLARRMGVPEKMEQLRRGELINSSEGRAALHCALRAPRADASDAPDAGDQAGGDHAGGESVAKAISDACDVRDRIWAFADAVRAGACANAAGDAFRHVVVVGIGGSYLGPEFVSGAIAASLARDVPQLGLRFLANVDPVGFEKAVSGLDATKTLFVVVSKSWTTQETLRNAELCKQWVLESWRAVESATAPLPAAIIKSQFAACASRSVAHKVEKWGVDSALRLFEFWDWVGGRYSSSASAGILPLALSCGSEAAKQFLAGAHAVDKHFFETPLERNIPAVMAMLGVWNVNFLGLGARAVVPYSEALSRFPAHVQQLEMESNGKAVTTDGLPLDYTTGEIVFGEPGTNAQHSFFQLLHMGQCVPCDFIGFMKPHRAENQEGHDELMANFFAQPDALAVGRTFEDVLNDVRVGDSDDLTLCPHRTLSGDRPSLSLLLPELSAGTVGMLLALYEHRCAVQGFVWDINSWDQWGVELGKKLASDIRARIKSPGDGARQTKHNPSTEKMLRRYAQVRIANEE